MESKISFDEFLFYALKGEALVGVDRMLARRFFAEFDKKKVEEHFGESFTFERNVVKTCQRLAFLTLLSGMGVSIPAFGWWSLLAIPILFIYFMLEYWRSITGDKKVVKSLILVILFSILGWMLSDHGIWVILFFVLFAMPRFFLRLTYVYATQFLRSIAMRNELVYNMLQSEDAIHIQAEVITDTNKGETKEELFLLDYNNKINEGDRKSDVFRRFIQSENLEMDEEQTEEGAIFFHTSQKISTGQMIRIMVWFSVDDKSVHIYIFDYANVSDESKKDAIYRLMNELHREYIFVQFYEQDGNITLKYSIDTEQYFHPSIVISQIGVLLSVGESAYNQFMKVIWS